MSCHFCHYFYCIRHPNIRQEIFPNSPSEKLVAGGGSLELPNDCAQNVFCTGIFLNTDDCDLTRRVILYSAKCHFVLRRLYVVRLWITNKKFEQHSSRRLAPLFHITSHHIPEYTNFCRLVVPTNSFLPPMGEAQPPTHSPQRTLKVIK